MKSSKALLEIGKCFGLPAILISGALAAEATDSGRRPEKDQAIKLSPFEVEGDSDTSYGALNSNSITQFNAELKRLPISADIFTETFMRDVAATSVEDVIQFYSAGAGFDTGQGAATAGNLQQGDRNANSSIQLRGLATTAVKRDGFLTMSNTLTTGTTGTGFSSNFDIERIEIINGPQSLLYGNGGGGGVINTVSKQARLGKRSFGSLLFQVDQFGHKISQLDYGVSSGNVAIRLAGVAGESAAGRRLYIGGPSAGVYLQFAFKLRENTIVRVTGERTQFDRVVASNPTFTAASAANDARNGLPLRYLLATNQIQSSATGASGAGVIANGKLTFDNVDSYMGTMLDEYTKDSFATLSIETRWSRTVSTSLSAGYKDFAANLRASSGLVLYPPNNPANPLGVWAAAITSSAPDQNSFIPAKTKAVRFSTLLDNELFGHRAKSQTIFGAEFTRINDGRIIYNYYQADSSFNVIRNPAIAANNGRTLLPRLIWPVQNGPIKDPFWDAGADRATLNGVNYIRMLANEVDTSRISPNNPLGVTLGGSVYTLTSNLNKGLYGLNSTRWWDGRLETLLGVRYADFYSTNQTAGVNNPTDSHATTVSRKKSFSYNAGANFALREWLRPYIAVSDSYNSPIAGTTPLGEAPKFAHALGAELGVKFATAGDAISGSIAAYTVQSKNEFDFLNATLGTDINPSGLNGRYGFPGTVINVDRTSQGVQLALAANPIRGWRLRLSAAIIDGTKESTRSYQQLYNDQFNANKQGQVTYADGSLVYVTPTFSASAPPPTASTPGAVPLTIAMMNDRTNTYYANPLPVTGQITSASNVGTILRRVDPVHGAILTGATGLPISDMQINPGFTPPGSIVVAKAGDVTSGYPHYSVNLTNAYKFENGWFSGVTVGGTIAVAAENRGFYYFENGVYPDAPRSLFNWADRTRLDLMASYTHRFRRVTLSTQVNVSNVGNHYNVVIIPNATTGFTAVKNATFDQQPRTYTWSSTVSF